MKFEGVKDILVSDSKFKIIKESGQELLIYSPYSTKIIKIPLKLSIELCALAGFVIGDGHIRKSKFSIEVGVTDFEIIKSIATMIKKSFDWDATIRIQKSKGKQDIFRIQIDSKPIWLFFTKILEIPPGKKCFTVKVPDVISHSDLEFKRWFLSGLFLADGGIKKHHFICFTSCSKTLIEGIEKILKEFSISTWRSEWISKISSRRIFDLFVKKQDSKRFEDLFPLTKLKLQGSPSLVNGASLRP